MSADDALRARALRAVYDLEARLPDPSEEQYVDAVLGATTEVTDTAHDGWQKCVEWIAYQGQADVKGWLLEAAEQANPYREG